MNDLNKFLELEPFINAQYHIDNPDNPNDDEDHRRNNIRLKFFLVFQHLAAKDFRPPFYKEMKNRRLTPKATWLGKMFLEFLIQNQNLSRLDPGASSFNDYAPGVDLILKIAQAAMSEKGKMVDGVGFIPALPIHPTLYDFCRDDEVDILVDAYAELALLMRNRLLDPRMKAIVKSYSRNAKERSKHAKAVIEQAWEKHASILLIRLDWGYHKNYFTKPYSEMSQEDFNRLLEQTSEHQSKMASILKEMFGDDLAFYMWKIECGDQKGIHLHWFLGLNGSKHQDRINVPLRIQREWDRQIGNGQTYTFNVNALRDAESSGLRVIHYYEAERLAIIHRYVDYLLKVDNTIKLRAPKGMRLFGCSKLKTHRRAKPGPKRKYAMPKSATPTGDSDTDVNTI